MFKGLMVGLFLFLGVVAPVSAYVPSDPMFIMQYYLKQIRADLAWDISKGDNVVVAVLDSGVDIDHPDLKANIWHNPGEIAGDNIDNDGNGFIDDVNGWDFTADVADPKPKFEADYSVDAVNHGTAVAGLIAAVGDNSEGMIGEAFHAKIMPLRIFGGNGEGNVAGLINAINYATENGADIINLSLVGIGGGEGSGLKEALENARRQGVFIAVASGNGKDGTGVNLDENVSYPSSYGNASDYILTTVSSVDAMGIKSTFANYGSAVGIAAPGEDMHSSAFYDGKGFDNYYIYGWRGTSFSTAMVSGAAALLKSKYPAISPSQIDAILKSTAKIIPDSGQKNGNQLDIAAALSVVPVVMGGYSVKLKNLPAVYFVDGNNTRHLFSSESIYWTRHVGSWSDQDVRVLSQIEFDALATGANMVAKEGNIIKFKNSDRMYSVGLDASLCQIADDAVAKQLFGADWQNNLIIVNDGFENDYKNDPACILNLASSN